MSKPLTPKQKAWRNGWLKGRDGAVRSKRKLGPGQRRNVAQYELRELRKPGVDRNSPRTAARRGAVYQFTLQGDLPRNPTRNPARKGQFGYGKRGAASGLKRKGPARSPAASGRKPAGPGAYVPRRSAPRPSLNKARRAFRGE